MEDFPKWFLRIMVVVGTIGFVTVYSMRHDFSKGWMPSFNAGDYSPPGAAPQPPVAQAPASEPATGETARPAAAPVAPAVAPAARSYVPCQPIGRTAKGELVYSMDCRNPPQ